MASPDIRLLTDPQARLTLFGHEPTPAEIEVIPRSPAWRLRKTIPVAVTTLLITPAVALVPPHAPWVAGALAGGFFLGRQRWAEYFTLRRLGAGCPRCGHRIRLDREVRLRDPHSLSCPGCGHEPILDVDPQRLEPL